VTKQSDQSAHVTSGNRFAEEVRKAVNSIVERQSADYMKTQFEDSVVMLDANCVKVPQNIMVNGFAERDVSLPRNKLQQGLIQLRLYTFSGETYIPTNYKLSVIIYSKPFLRERWRVPYLATLGFLEVLRARHMEQDRLLARTYYGKLLQKEARGRTLEEIGIAEQVYWLFEATKSFTLNILFYNKNKGDSSAVETLNKRYKRTTYTNDNIYRYGCNEQQMPITQMYKVLGCSPEFKELRTLFTEAAHFLHERYHESRQTISEGVGSLH